MGFHHHTNPVLGKNPDYAGASVAIARVHLPPEMGTFGQIVAGWPLQLGVS